jgi:hypothetical protein
VDIGEYQKKSTRRSEAKRNWAERGTPDNRSASVYSGYNTVKEFKKEKEWATPGRRTGNG